MHNLKARQTPVHACEVSETTVRRGSISSSVVLVLLLLSGFLSFLSPDVNAASQTVSTIQVGDSPDAVAVNPVTNTVYVADDYDNNITVIDGTTNRLVANITVGDCPDAVAVNPASNTIYVANSCDNTVSVIDGRTLKTIADITVGGWPSALAVDPNTGNVYVTNADDNKVSVIDHTTNRVTENFTVGGLPLAIAVNPNLGRIYVADSADNNVTVVDSSSFGQITNVTVGDFPRAVAVNPISGRVYVADNADNNVTVIDGTTNRSVANITVGESPDAVAVDPLSGNYFVASYDDNNVTLLDPSNVVLGVIPVGNSPVAIALNPQTGVVYVANSDDNTVSVILEGMWHTVTKVTCNSPTVLLGVSVTCTATVEGLLPTGTVMWSQFGPGSVSFSSYSCTLSFGQCSTIVTGTRAGQVALWASYLGDSANLASNGKFVITFNTVFVRCAKWSPAVRTSTTCTATVIGSSPTGTIIWSQSGAGFFAFSSNTCALVGGACSVTLVGKRVGTVNLRAFYGGDASNPVSFGSARLSVGKAKTALSVSCKWASRDVWTCTVTLKGYFGSVRGKMVAWSQESGSGVVSFSPSICILSPKGTCSTLVRGIAKGSVTVAAAYVGDKNNLRSLGTANLKVT